MIDLQSISEVFRWNKTTVWNPLTPFCKEQGETSEEHQFSNAHIKHDIPALVVNPFWVDADVGWHSFINIGTKPQAEVTGEKGHFPWQVISDRV